jgi:hypothetical protein
VGAFGFRLSRISGSHHIFVHDAIPELVNLQEVSGQAKPYQVRHFMRIVERYNLQRQRGRVGFGNARSESGAAVIAAELRARVVVFLITLRICG